MSAKYAPLYVAEFQFRYNNRMNPDIFGTAIDAAMSFIEAERELAMKRSDKRMIAAPIAKGAGVGRDIASAVIALRLVLELDRVPCAAVIHSQGWRTYSSPW